MSDKTDCMERAPRACSPPLRILLVEPSGQGGVAQHAHNLANGLAVLGHRVALATRVAFETKPVPRDYAAWEVFDRFRPHPVALLRFARFVRRFRPDIVHIDGALHPGAYFLIWQAMKRITPALFVYTAQDVVSKTPRPYHAWVLRRIYQGMAHVAVNLHQNRDAIIRQFNVPPERVSCIPIGDLLYFLRQGQPLPAQNAAVDEPCALFFGFIEPRKGILTLIRAFADVHAAFPRARLVIAGRAVEDTSRYTNEIRALGLESCVSWRASYVSFEEIPRLFAAADVVVLPYEAGWSSGVVLTAYGFGKPVVATDVGGLPEIVQEGSTGLIVPPGDVAALAGALRRMFDDTDGRKRMAAAAGREAERFSWRAIAAETERMYRGVIARAGGSCAPRCPTGNQG